MSVSAPALDKRSLTLPDWRAKIKNKIKRRRPPSFLEIVYLSLALFEGVHAVLEFLRPDYLAGGEGAVLAGIYWKAYLYIRADNPVEAFRWVIIACAFAFSGLVWVR